jgi:hypothetical protein
MNTVPATYEQPLDAHYATIFARNLQRTKEPPPAGWQKAVLELSPGAIRVDAGEENKFMEALKRLIRERCSGSDPRKAGPQGLWIRAFDSFEILNRHLRGSRLRVYAGGSVPRLVWVEVACAAGPFRTGDVFRS